MNELMKCATNVKHLISPMFRCLDCSDASSEVACPVGLCLGQVQDNPAVPVEGPGAWVQEPDGRQDRVELEK